MNDPRQMKLLRGLVAQLDGGPAFGAAISKRPASDYTSRDRFERERSRVFARAPSIVAHESELAEPGSCLTAEVAGVALLLMRAEDGTIGAFRNACRHRSTQLVSSSRSCATSLEDPGSSRLPCDSAAAGRVRKAIVCPYHGWTYDLRGRLIHVPHEETFRGEHRSRDRLVGAHAAARHGFIWAGLEPFDLGSDLEPIDEELSGIGVGGLTLYQRVEREVRGNWKLIIEAFLDGYHIRHLHRDSIYRFFIDAVAEAEPAGSHIRAINARRTLLEARAHPLDTGDIRQVATPSYLVYPNTTLVLHPDYLSVIIAIPIAPERTRFIHEMLIPGAPKTEAEKEHWAKSFALIDRGVFLAEDLAAVEAMQRGIESGANESLLFGELEHAAHWFHESLDRDLDLGRS
jgi:phenylpropionate dioxygenase-like ring-hydroxylating dioxygenase large terminal subunit